jgi:taurine dioxygenase
LDFELEEAEMAAVLQRQRIEVKPTGAALGADIEGVDLARELSLDAVDAIKQAWADHLVLRFRGQRLDDDQLIRFSAHFGELDWAPVIAASRVKIPGEDRYVESVEEGRRYISVKAIGALGAYESVWHTDMSYNPEPPCASALYALEAPPSGGDTGFANMYFAYETMPGELRQQVEGRLCRHDSTYNSAGELRRGFSEVTDPRKAPGADHPIIRTHPVTGRRALFLGRRRNAYILGLELEESDRLLDALWAHAARPELTWYQQWRVGDLVLWDNRCVMHRRDEFDPNSRRLMHRSQIKGDRPY